MGSAKTSFTFSSESPAELQADGLLIPVFKKPADKAKKSSKLSSSDNASTTDIIWPFALDKALLTEILALASEEKFDGSRGKLLTFRQTGRKGGTRRLVLIGLGEAASVQPRHWEINVQKAVSGLLGLKDFQTVAIALPTAEQLNLSAAVALSVDAVLQATYKSMEAKDPPADLRKVILITAQKADASLHATLKEALSLAQARSLVKDLVNHPSNLKNTNTLVNQAKTIGKNALVSVTVQDKAAWIQKNMPCFYTVAQGSVATDPPKFIQLRYQPKSGGAKKHIAIVGKSVIFDTGGYQVKPGDSMLTMKGDMTGGAVALATMQALAELQPQNIEVSAYLAATPNKIDSDAMIPDSIVNTTCGKKVEIRHTDAEGRLTLIDAVAKAAENKPQEIITIATLTGSASQAVGYSIALMGNNDDLRERVLQAGRLHAEPIQTLDVTEEDYENIKSKLDGADIINTSQRRHRGAQSAAAFVMSGAPDDVPMAHMDIAGADMTGDEKATGISVKTIIQYLLTENEALSGGRSTPQNKSRSGTASAGGKRTASSAKATTTKTSSASAVRAATVTKKAKPAVKAPKDRQPPKKTSKPKSAPKPKAK
jgi:leucyl aminopeptidase